MTHIHFILTGGTIDKSYNPSTEVNDPNPESVIPFFIEERVKPHFEFSFNQVCLLDSLDITDSMRGKIVKAVKNAPSDRVVIVCGTSAMVDIARLIDAKLGKSHGKTVVFVGAMYPMKEFALSDGGFNIGYAVSQVQSKPPGHYICMNAKTFRPDEVTKNVGEGRFEIEWCY